MDPLKKYMAESVRLTEARFDENTLLEDEILAEMATLWAEMTPEQKQEAERHTLDEV